MPASDRPTFSDRELTQYFEYIELPEDVRQRLRSQDFSGQLKAIDSLIRSQLSHVPFENLDLHYASVRGVSLEINHLFEKIVGRKNGRGGYCMQNNSLFATVLRSLGYDVMTAGARVAMNIDNGVAGESEPRETSFGAFSHQVSILTIDGKRYVADVGFGSQGPTSLLPLRHGYTAQQTGTGEKGGATMKLTRGFTANNTSRNKEQEVWLYNIKYGASTDNSKPWNTVYCFTEAEFFPGDFEMASAWVSTKVPMFVNTIICSKFLLSEDGQSLIGDITLNHSVIKERKFGRNETLQDLKSEDDRVNALQKYLGVRLSQGEIHGIHGYHSALS